MSSRIPETADALISLLDALESATDEQSIRTLGENIGVPKSTVHRLLQGLLSKGWVYQDDRTKNYSIGLRFLCQAEEWRRGLSVVRIAEAALHDLSLQCEQTVVLSILHKEQVLCVEKIDSLSILHIASQIGHVYPLHAGATCKTALAYAPQMLINKVMSTTLRRYTPLTTVDHLILQKQLQKIKNDGYCFTKEEVDPGVAALAAPVLGKDHELICIVTIAGAYFYILENKQRYLELLLATVSRLEKDFRGS